MQQNCPILLTTGICNVENCPHNHTILSCDPCAIVVQNANEYGMHLQSRKHKQAIEGTDLNQLLHCQVCDCTVNRTIWESHRAGQRHVKQARNKGMDVDTEPTVAIPLGTKFCTHCEKAIVEPLWDDHVKGREHLQKEEYFTFKTALNNRATASETTSSSEVVADRESLNEPPAAQQ